jgi:hypothetical protein
VLAVKMAWGLAGWWLPRTCRGRRSGCASRASRDCCYAGDDVAGLRCLRRFAVLGCSRLTVTGHWPLAGCCGLSAEGLTAHASPVLEGLRRGVQPAAGLDARRGPAISSGQRRRRREGTETVRGEHQMLEAEGLRRCLASSSADSGVVFLFRGLLSSPPLSRHACARRPRG